MEAQLNFKAFKDFKGLKDFKGGPPPLKFNWAPPQLDFKGFKGFKAFKFL